MHTCLPLWIAWLSLGILPVWAADPFVENTVTRIELRIPSADGMRSSIRVTVFSTKGSAAHTGRMPRLNQAIQRGRQVCIRVKLISLKLTNLLS